MEMSRLGSRTSESVMQIYMYRSSCTKLGGSYHGKGEHGAKTEDGT